MSRATGHSRFELVVGAALTAFTVYVCFAMSSWFLREPAPLGSDEGYMAAVGIRLATGRWLPYVDAASQRGPVLYWIMALTQRLGGLYTWTAIRTLGLVCTGAVTIASFLVGVIARRPIGGALGGAFFVYVIYFAYDVGAGTAVNGETVAAPFAMLAVVAVGYGLTVGASGAATRRKWVLAAAGGLLSALAGLVKQPLLALAGPLGLWLLADALIAPRAPGRWRPLVAFVVSWLAPLVALVALYAAVGELRTLVYWLYTYNTRVYMGPYAGVSVLRELRVWVGQNPYPTLVVAVVVAAAIGRTLSNAASLRPRDLVASYAGDGMQPTLTLLGVLAIAVTAIQLRFWPHQLITAIPYICTLAGLQISETLRGAAPGPRRLGVVVALAGVAAYLDFTIGGRLEDFANARRNGEWTAARPDGICTAVEAHSGPGDTLFVWGFDADLYVTCRRRPASRFVYTTLIAGIVPPFWADALPERAAKDGAAIARGDLEQSRPPVILDVPDSYLRGHSIREIPALRELLDRDYCPAGDVRGKFGRRATVYLRRDRGGCV